MFCLAFVFEISLKQLFSLTGERRQYGAMNCMEATMFGIQPR